MLKELREFMLKGNLVDMAVGIVIGAAFGTVVQSLVKDIIMPPIGVAMGGVDFTNIFVVIKGEGEFATLAEAAEAGAVTMNIGLFINSLVSFVIIACAIFLVVKSVNAARKRFEEEKAASAPPKQELLLGEIRDLLKSKAK